MCVTSSAGLPATSSVRTSSFRPGIDRIRASRSGVSDPAIAMSPPQTTVSSLATSSRQAPSSASFIWSAVSSGRLQ